MFRKTFTNRISPTLAALLRPEDKSSAATKEQTDYLLRARSTSVFRNLQDATFFSTRQTTDKHGNAHSLHSAVLSTTLRRLDKAVKRVVDIERYLARESASHSESSSLRKKLNRTTATLEVNDGLRREDVIIARMLLGEHDLGSEGSQMASLAGKSMDDKNSARANQKGAGTAETKRLESELRAALNEVREGVQGIGRLSTLGISKVFEAILSKGQAITALAILSKWLHDSHFGTVDETLPITSELEFTAKSPTYSPFVGSQRELLVFPFGDCASTGVGTKVDGSAFVCGLPGRAVIVAAMVAAASYDRENFIKAQINSTTARELSEESEVFDSEGDLYVIELCKRWICNPNAVLAYRHEVASIAASTLTSGSSGEAEILQTIRDTYFGGKLHTSSQTVPPLALLSQTDEVVLMIFLALGALNCRGSLPLLQKRFASLSGYSDRIQLLTEKVLQGRTTEESRQRKDNTTFPAVERYHRTVSNGDRAAEIASGLRSIEVMNGNELLPVDTPYYGLLTAQEQLTVATIDKLHGRLAAETAQLKDYAVKLILRVFEVLRGSDTKDVNRIQWTAISVVLEILSCILCSCDGESPVALNIAMSAHRANGAVVNAGASDTMDDDEEKKVEEPTDEKMSYTKLNREKRAQKVQSRKKGAPNNPTAQPTPSPTPSSAFALGLLFPHKAWRAIVNLPTLKSAQVADAEAGREHHLAYIREAGTASTRPSFSQMLEDLEQQDRDSVQKPSTTKNVDKTKSPPSQISRPTSSIMLDQLYLCAFDSIESALGVLVNNNRTSNASLRENVSHLSKILHSNESNNALPSASHGGPPPSAKAENTERFDILVRGIESSAVTQHGTSSEYEALEGFTIRGGYEKPAALTSFPLQSQLVQFTMREPTSFADKRHHSLFQSLSPEASPVHHQASSGVEFGLGNGLEVHELMVWQTPSKIVEEISNVWKSYVRDACREDDEAIAQSQIPNLTDADSMQVEWARSHVKSANFHVFRRWLQLLCATGANDKIPAALETIRSDIIADTSNVYRNFKSYLAKMMLSGIGFHPNSPLLLGAHAIPDDGRWERESEVWLTSLSSSHQQKEGYGDTLELATQSYQSVNGIVLVNRTASIRNTIDNKENQIVNPYVASLDSISRPKSASTLASQGTGWEGVGFIDVVVAFPMLLSGYLWADPKVSILGPLAPSGTFSSDEGGLTSPGSGVRSYPHNLNTISGDIHGYRSRDLLPFIEKLPAQWWQFVVANEIWNIRPPAADSDTPLHFSSDRILSNNRPAAMIRALVEVLHFMFIGAAVHGRSLLERKDRSIEEACLYAHFCGDGSVSLPISLTTNESTFTLFPSSAAATQRGVPSVRAFYKLLLATMHQNDMGKSNEDAGISKGTTPHELEEKISGSVQTPKFQEPALTSPSVTQDELETDLQFDDDGEMAMLMAEKQQESSKTVEHRTGKNADNQPPEKEVRTTKLMDELFKETKAEVLYRSLVADKDLFQQTSSIIFDATPLVNAWFPVGAVLPPTFSQLCSNNGSLSPSGAAEAMEEWALRAQRSIFCGGSRYTPFAESRTQILGIFAATFDPYMVLLSWVVLGGGLSSITPANYPCNRRISLGGTDLVLQHANFLVNKAHSLQSRHIIIICRMFAAMGITADAVLNDLQKEGALYSASPSTSEYHTVALPLSAVDIDSEISKDATDSGCLQQLWNQHIVSIASRELFLLMLSQPETLSNIRDLTFGVILPPSRLPKDHTTQSPFQSVPHEAVRFVFRAELMSRGIGLEHESLLTTTIPVLATVPLMQNAMVTPGRPSSLPPIDSVKPSRSRNQNAPASSHSVGNTLPESFYHQYTRRSILHGRRDPQQPSPTLGGNMFGFSIPN